jgi:hypothetical protein
VGGVQDVLAGLGGLGLAAGGVVADAGGGALGPALEIHQAIAEGDTAVLHCTFSGRHTGPFLDLAPTNRPFAYRQVHIVRFQDGKSIEHWAIRDDLGFLRQVVALPSQPARPIPADA